MLAMARNYRQTLSLHAYYVSKGLQLQTCINGKSTLDPSVQKNCKDWGVAPERILLPLGVIDMLQVPWPATDLISAGEEGSLSKTYTPDRMQQMIAALALWAQSSVHLCQVAGIQLPGGDLEQWFAGPDFPKSLKIYGGASVQDALDGNHLIQRRQGAGFFPVPLGKWILPPNWITKDGRTLEPTDDELHNSDGLYKYYARGGWLVYEPMFNGQEAIWQQSLAFNVGYFQCAQGIGVSTQAIPDEGHGWLAFVKFGPQYTIKIQMKDRSFWESVGHAVKSVVIDAFHLICKAAPLASTVTQQTAALKHCTLTGVSKPTDAQKKAAGCDPWGDDADCLKKVRAMSCMEGEPGCVCTPIVGDAYAAAAAAGAALLQAGCQYAEGSAEPVTCDQFQPPPVGPSTWMLVGAGLLAAVGGAALFTRKR